jgi:hypothetical protein
LNPLLTNFEGFLDRFDLFGPILYRFWTVSGPFLYRFWTNFGLKSYLPGGGMKLEQKGFFVRSPPNCCGGCSLKLATNGLLLTPGWLTRDKSERKKRKIETFAETICFSYRNSYLMEC